MTTYYCDLSLDFQDASGVDTGANVLRGVGGLQAALRGKGSATALAAGDELRLKGTGQVGRLVHLVTGKDVSAWAAGDEVRNDTGDGDHWTGVVVHNTAHGQATAVLIELDSGYTRDDVQANWPDGVENTTKGDSTTISGASAYGIEWDVAGQGDATNGMITLRGVKSDWSTGNGSLDYCATLDAQGVADVAFTCDSNNPKNYCWFRNLVFTNGKSYSFDGYVCSMSYSRFEFCVFKNAGQYGCYYLVTSTDIDFLYCIFEGNGLIGIYYGPNSSMYYRCIYRNNGNFGTYYCGQSFWAECLFVDNTWDGFGNNYYGSHIIHSTADGNRTGIAVTDGRNLIVLGCRVTNNSEYGVSQPGPNPGECFEDGNVFYNNTLGNVRNCDQGGSSVVAASAAEAGYVNQPGGDYTLTAAAIRAGTNASAIPLDWTQSPSNTGYYTAGALPMEYAGSLSPDDVVDPQYVIVGQDNYTGGEPGTFVVPLESTVLLATTYGHAAEFTGTLYAPDYAGKAAVAWPVYVNALPDEPDNCIGVFDTGGLTDGRTMAGNAQDRPGVQIRIRGEAHEAAYVKADAVEQALDAIKRTNVTMPNGHTYRIDVFTRNGPIVRMGEDEEGRINFTINGRLVRVATN